MLKVRNLSFRIFWYFLFNINKSMQIFWKESHHVQQTPLQNQALLQHCRTWWSCLMRQQHWLCEQHDLYISLECLHLCDTKRQVFCIDFIHIFKIIATYSLSSISQKYYLMKGNLKKRKIYLSSLNFFFFTSSSLCLLSRASSSSLTPSSKNEFLSKIRTCSLSRICLLTSSAWVRDRKSVV